MLNRSVNTFECVWVQYPSESPLGCAFAPLRCQNGAKMTKLSHPLYCRTSRIYSNGLADLMMDVGRLDGECCSVGLRGLKEPKERCASTGLSSKRNSCVSVS